MPAAVGNLSSQPELWDLDAWGTERGRMVGAARVGGKRVRGLGPGARRGGARMGPVETDQGTEVTEGLRRAGHGS